MRTIRAFSFNDVLLVPKFSSLESRHEANLRSRVGPVVLDFPIVSAPMDTVTEENMALFMWEKGGFGVIHRYMDVNKQFSQVKWVKEMGARVGAAIGVNHDAKERAEALADAGVDIFVIDIAHGHTKKALELVSYLKSTYHLPVMSGNIVTNDAARDYLDAGATVLRIGVGAGSACSTRQVAAVGYPQLSAISNIHDFILKLSIEYRDQISLVSDGGIKSSGDIVKALAAGADAVMAGGLLAPFVVSAGRKYSLKVEQESPLTDVFPAYIPDRGSDVARLYEEGASRREEKIPRYITVKEFRGMASENALKSRKNNFVIEGESFYIPVRYDQDDYMNSLRDGVQQGFAYLGAKNIKQLRDQAEFVEVSHNGYIEGTPHYNGGIKFE